MAKKRDAKVKTAYSATVYEMDDGTVAVRITGQWYSIRGGDELRDAPKKNLLRLQRKIMMADRPSVRVQGIKYWA